MKTTKIPERLCWIDLETTGLNPNKDHILEIAAIITDINGIIIAEMTPIVIYHNLEETTISPEVMTMHKKSGLWDEVLQSIINTKQAEELTLNFIMQHCKQGETPLCGNSIWLDKSFLYAYMPRITSFLHYRIIDVSSIKILIQSWYPNSQSKLFEKKENHRANPDIKESIIELLYYKKHFFR